MREFGLELCAPAELRSQLNLFTDFGFEFVCVPLVHPRFKREFIARWKDRSEPFTRPDLVLHVSEWSSLITGKISPYLNVECESMNSQAQFALEQEVKYGSHLRLSAIVIPIRSSKCFNLARIIKSILIEVKSLQIWVEVPMISHEKSASAWRSDLNEKETIGSTWEWWNNVHVLCDLDKRLGVVLEITNAIPDEQELKRWMVEPLKALVIPTCTFRKNKKGYPVLSKAIRSFIKSLVVFEIQFIIRGNGHRQGIDSYRKYIEHLWQQADAEHKKQLGLISSDALIQAPTKSLHDRTSSDWKMSFKYKQYAKALHEAVLDRVHKGDRSEKVLNIMVVGAGRGHLIFTVLEMAEKFNQKVKIYAVEVNPHDFWVLQAYQEEFWPDVVEIISENILGLVFPQIIDILICEISGSLKESELSPEILDKAQKFLKEGGATIPESYTSYMEPVQCTKVYRDMKECDKYTLCERPCGIEQKEIYGISTVKPLFSFHHANCSKPLDGHSILTYDVKQNCILHGFTGYFEAVLYKDVKLSFLPDSKGQECSGWNPTFFPLSNPVNLRPGDKLEAHFWRLVGKGNTWYEWTVTKPLSLPVHNPRGRSACTVLM